MSKNNFLGELARILMVKIEDLNDSTPIAGHIDSLGATELVYQVEDEFGVTMTYDQVDNLKDVEALEKVIGQKISEVRKK